MMWEEFEQLTGVQVSLAYYQETIEPEYARGDINKQDFCAAWKKQHKAELITCLGSDFHSMARRASLEVTKAGQENTYLKDRLEQSEKLNRELTSRIKELDRDVKELGEMVDGNASIIEDKELEITELKASQSNEYQQQLKAKDFEIMTLKAKLYDVLNGVSA